MWGSTVIASPTILALKFATSQSDINIFNLLGSPTYRVLVQVTITDTSAITAFTTGPLAAGSLVILKLNGYVLGKGGKGGIGASSPFEGPPDSPADATPGLVGGNAIEMLCDMRLDMDNGYILAGGGGGGGGGAGPTVGGGGGGGGVSGGLGGAGGAPNDQPGSAATSGITATPGAGGITPAGNGGLGGDWADSGDVGVSTGAGSSYNFGAAGGNAGLSINTNSFALSFIGAKNEATLRSEDRLKGVIL